MRWILESLGGRNKMRRLLVFSIMLTVSPFVWAQIPSLEVEPLVCLPKDGNRNLEVRTEPTELPEGWGMRTYFRRQDHGNFYYVPTYPYDEDLRPDLLDADTGKVLIEKYWTQWGVFPKPLDENVSAEYYVSIHNEEGQAVAQSETNIVEVTDDCEVDMVENQRDFAEELVIGETVVDQQGKKVIWWQCDGMDTRIGVAGDLREDRSCFPAIIWWKNPKLMIPLAVVGIGITTVIIDDGDETPASPSTP